MPNRLVDDSSAVYLIGSGIASLAAAAFLIRDGNIPGHNITVFEQSDKIGGSLDAAGSPQDGYIMRGGRMLESKYVCTFDLFSSIPTLDESKTVTQEIFEFNETIRTSSKSRIFRNGHRVDAPKFGLSEKQILTIERLLLESEDTLGRSSIADHFDLRFFETDFWFMWCTTFAFQPWHSAVEFRRYLVRFMHMILGFSTLTGIMRTVYNQYDSMVRPLQKWLQGHGVKFRMNTRVTYVSFHHSGDDYSVQQIFCERDGQTERINVNEQDLVIATLGSMTEASSFGSMDSAPVLKGKSDGGSWHFWETLAEGQSQFGHPRNFSNHIEESKWISFTTTLRDPTFFQLVRDVTGNVAGEGGLVTFPESNWLASIVLAHQPHFPGQPADVQVFWGYGLSVDNTGNFVNKPMSACTGREIMTEIIGHLGIEVHAGKILESCTCIPCMMPFITSQFLRREKGDRPQVLPPHSKNLALIGQFCELPDDVVFTVEYSVRSAQNAVYSLLGLKRTPPPVYKGQYDPRVLRDAFLTLHGKEAHA